MFLLYFYGVKNYLFIRGEQPVSLFLSQTYLDDREASELLPGEKAGEVCFYRDCGLRTVSQPDYGRQTRVLVGEIRGSSGNFDSRAAGFGERDTEGCMVDEATAELLFGSRAPGGRLALGERIYTVRRVLPWKQRFLLIRPADGTASYDRVFLRRKPGESPTKTAELFLMRNQLSGVTVKNGLWREAALLALLLLPAGMVTALFRRGFRIGREEKGTLVSGLWLCFLALLLVLLLYYIMRTAVFPADWLPPRWSDFGFWRQKLAEEREAVRLYLLFPKTVPELEQMLCAGKVILASGTAFVLFCIKKVSVM